MQTTLANGKLTVYRILLLLWQCFQPHGSSPLAWRGEAAGSTPSFVTRLGTLQQLQRHHENLPKPLSNEDVSPHLIFIALQLLNALR
jgi:hypothetical protein